MSFIPDVGCGDRLAPHGHGITALGSAARVPGERTHLPSGRNAAARFGTAQSDGHPMAPPKTDFEGVHGSLKEMGMLPTCPETVRVAAPLVAGAVLTELVTVTATGPA